MLTVQVIVLISVLVVSVFVATNAQDLLWSQDFDLSKSGTPDSKVWSYDTGGGGWGNNELQTYQKDNVKVENGKLVISVDRNDDGTFTSGRIHTKSKLEFVYGRIEARIKIPDPANGLWPSFWMLGANFDDVGWPRSGSMTLAQMGSASALQKGQAKSRVGSALHWEKNGSDDYDSNDVDTGKDLTSEFHTFVMDWTPESITTSVDGTQILKKDISSSGCSSCDEFHRPFFLILSVAVGGRYMNLLDAGDITAPLPASMEVESIKIFDNGDTQLGGSSITSPPTISPTESPTTALPTLPPSTMVTQTTIPPTVFQLSAPSSSPSVVPVTPEATLSPSVSPSTAPTQTTTTAEPTTAPTVSPTGSPTSSPTDSPTDSPTKAAPTFTALNARAENVVMTLDNVQPLDEQAQKDWTKATRIHLTNEAMNVIGGTNVQVDVTIVSQKPPYQGKVNRGLRRLQGQQVITFNADYTLPSSGMRLNSVDSFVAGAFVSHYKRVLYMGRLKENSGKAFEEVTSVSVETSSSAPPRVKGQGMASGGDESVDVGLVVGVMTAFVIVIVLGIALYARRRREGTVIVEPLGDEHQQPKIDSSIRKEVLSDRSGTIDDESMYTYNYARGDKVAPYGTYDNGSSIAASSQFADDDTNASDGLWSMRGAEHANYRDTFRNISRSVWGGLLLGGNAKEEERTVCNTFAVEVPPQGKLGLILETSDERGCPTTVEEVKLTSPFSCRVKVGDRLLSVNGQHVTSETVSNVIARTAKSEETRVFVFERPQER